MSFHSLSRQFLSAMVLIAVAAIPAVNAVPIAAVGLPTIDKSSVLITARMLDSYWSGGQRDESQYSWVPIMNFKVNGPISSGTVFTVDYLLPGNIPWITFDLTSEKEDTDSWYSYDRAGNDIPDQKGTMVTGPINFKISMSNELDGTPKTTLLSGKFTVKRYNFNNFPEYKNKFDFYVDQDWRLPIAFLWGNWWERGSGSYSENMTPGLWGTVWLHGENTINTQAFLYYQGKEISSADGSAEQSATTQETSTHNWVAFSYPLQAFWFNHADNPESYSWFDMGKNPGDYQIKILAGGKLTRVISFTIGPDGKIVDNGFAGQANHKYNWIFPAQITGTVEGGIAKDAYKTDAFYGNPLSGFVAP